MKARTERRLHAEGYFADQIEGREQGAQLKATIDAARKAEKLGRPDQRRDPALARLR
jgi:hypothetical protein